MQTTRASGRALRHALVAAGRDFHARGWVLGTSGNFSAVVSDRPRRLVITPSGADKGALDEASLVEVDGRGRVVAGDGRASAETALHLAIVGVRRARAVLHTHSVWATILSEQNARAGGLTLSGYEMLKGLEGVRSHEHREWLPIVANDQDVPRLARRLRVALRRDRRAHGVLLSGHGLYTWGPSVSVARRHVEILEFLLEVAGRNGRTWERDHGTHPNPR